jgi:hypothetical protein
MMAQTNMVDGLSFMVKINTNSLFCKGCVYGNMIISKKFLSIYVQEVSILGQLIHVDNCIPMSVTSISGSLYFVLSKDDCISC